MTDHADTIRRLDNLANRLMGVPWAQALAEMENDELPDSLADAVRFVAERQQAIDERDAARKALKGTEKALASTTSELEETEDAFAAERARCEQAIDALRDTAARLDALADEGLYAVDPVREVVRAALLSLGEQGKP